MPDVEFLKVLGPTAKSHRMEGMGERERRSGQGDPYGEVTGDNLRAFPLMPVMLAMLVKLLDFS